MQTDRSRAAYPAVHIVACLPLLLVAVLPLVAAFFAFLQTDDFCTFGRMFKNSLNPIRETYYLYENWTGRYTSSFIIAAVASVSSFVPIQIAYSGALVGFITLFAWASVRASALPSGHSRSNPMLALVIFSSAMLFVPSKLEQYLWLTGAAVYFVGVPILLLLIRGLLAADATANARKSNEAYHYFLIIVAVGINEFIAIVVGACLLWSAFHRFRANRDALAQFIRLLVFALAFAVTVLAPGNFARDSAAALPRHQVLEAVGMALNGSVDFARALLSENGLAWAASLIAALVAGFLSGATSRRIHRNWFPYVVILVGAFPMHLWLYSFLTGEPVPGRILNQAFMLFHIAACLLFGALGMWLAQKFDGTGQRLAVAAFAISSLALPLSGASRELSTALLGFAPQWQAEQMQRHRALLELQGTGDPVYVRPFSSPGNVGQSPFVGGDVGAMPTYWVNQCVSGFYGVPSIILMKRLQHESPNRADRNRD